jgi:hypothetical protein
VSPAAGDLRRYGLRRPNAEACRRRGAALALLKQQRQVSYKELAFHTEAPMPDEMNNLLGNDS